MPEMLDPLGRKVDYLRISVTDRCNERCLYCMPADYQDWLPRDEVLTREEIRSIAAVGAELGVRRIRLTGGEPTARRDLPEIVADLASIPGIGHLSLTTNGTRLRHLAAPLRAAGLHSLNVSLDALDKDRYHAITGGRLSDALEGLEAARGAGFESIKLNAVLIRGRNEDQINALIDFAEAAGLIIRFIELMPVSLTEMLDESNFLPVAEVRRSLGSLLPLERSFGSGPAQYFRLEGRKAVVGFISALSDLHFCDRCNKMRITCDGKLRPCLGNHLENDLKPGLRPTIQPEKLRSIFLETLQAKPAEHIFRENYQPQRIMTAIGG